MKTQKHELSYWQITFYAILAEFVLIGAQLAYIQIHNMVNEVQLAFDQLFIKNTSIYIFLGIGFIVFMLLAVWVRGRVAHNWFNKLLTLFIAGSVVEVIFYIVMLQANYEGAFLYSVLDKFLGVFFGVVIYNIGIPRGTHVRQ